MILEDYLLYQYARTRVIIIQALRSLPGENLVPKIEGPGAEATVRKA